MIKSSILTLTLALALAMPAWASANHPTGAYAPFAGCPLSSDANLCMVSDVTGGEVVVGKRVVPIGKTIELQGGLNTETGTGEIEFVGAEEGETLTKVALMVPGGLLSLVTPGGTGPV